jgi:hypothetical protein
VEDAPVGTGKKNARRQRAWIVFEDESGVSQQPVVRRTWAPRGETPILIHTGGNWKRLSIAGALAFRWDGRRTRFFFQTRAGSYSDVALIAFLRDLKRHFPRGRVLLIWDGLSGHTSRLMAAYLARQRAWLTVERLPGYAPDLNPIEQLWGQRQDPGTGQRLCPHPRRAAPAAPRGLCPRATAAAAGLRVSAACWVGVLT